MSRNEDYNGLNALFDLPIDVSKADPEAAAAYLESFKSSETEDNVLSPSQRENLDGIAGSADDMLSWFEQLNAENLEDLATRVESTVQTLTPDENGYIDTGVYEIEGRGGSEGGQIQVSWVLSELEVGVTQPIGFHSSGTLDTLCIETYTLNADGTYTFAVYIPKE